jgi:hypothetical protein
MPFWQGAYAKKAKRKTPAPTPSIRVLIGYDPGRSICTAIASYLHLHVSLHANTLSICTD